MELVKEKNQPSEQPIKQASPVRLSFATKKQLDVLLEKANKKSFGKKVKPTDLIELALTLVDDQHLESLKQSSLSNLDRLEMLYDQFSKENPGVTKDEIIGQLLSGELTKTTQKKRAKSK